MCLYKNTIKICIFRSRLVPKSKHTKKDIWQKPEPPGQEHPEDWSHESWSWQESLKVCSREIPVSYTQRILKWRRRYWEHFYLNLSKEELQGSHLEAKLIPPITQANRTPLSTQDSEFISTMAPTHPNRTVHNKNCTKTLENKATLSDYYIKSLVSSLTIPCICWRSADNESWSESSPVWRGWACGWAVDCALGEPGRSVCGPEGETTRNHKETIRYKAEGLI